MIFKRQIILTACANSNEDLAKVLNGIAEEIGKSDYTDVASGGDYGQEAQSDWAVLDHNEPFEPLAYMIRDGMERDLAEDAKNGSDWFNAFQDVDSYLAKYYCEDESLMDEERPEKTLINCIKKLEAENELLRKGC